MAKNPYEIFCIHKDACEADIKSAYRMLLGSNRHRSRQNHKNVIVTPHSAFYTRKAVERILQTTGDNILSFVAAGPRNIVSNTQQNLRDKS